LQYSYKFEAAGQLLSIRAKYGVSIFLLTVKVISLVGTERTERRERDNNKMMKTATVEKNTRPVEQSANQDGLLLNHRHGLVQNVKTACRLKDKALGRKHPTLRAKKS
jgi:hypothetical protein